MKTNDVCNAFRTNIRKVFMKVADDSKINATCPIPAVRFISQFYIKKIVSFFNCMCFTNYNKVCYVGMLVIPRIIPNI